MNEKNNTDISKEKTVCYFGIYDPRYSRNRVIIEGLKRNNCDVVECRVDPEKISGFRKYIALWKRGKQIDTKVFDHIIVGFPGHSVMWLARLLFGKRIIFDAFVSLYDSNVLDRGVYKKISFGAIKEWLLDWYACVLAYRILLDTNAHIDFFVRSFRLPRKKFIRVLVGTTEEFTPSGTSRNSAFTIYFHGTFIPLQGVQYIVEAARILRNEDITFRILGDGGGYHKDIIALIEKHALTNITLIGRVPLEELPRHIGCAHVCLGIFGDTKKTTHVIPNKVYEYAAMGCPIITSDTPAIRELFENGEDILLCKRASGESLAENILLLKNNKILREKIGENARKVFLSNATPQLIGKSLLNDLSLV